MGLSISRAWQKLGKVDTEGLPQEEARKLRSLNQFTLVTLIALFPYALGYALAGDEFYPPLIVTLVVSALHVVNRRNIAKRRHVLAVGLFLLLLNGQIAFVTAFTGTAFGFHYYFLTFIAVVPQIVPRRMFYYSVFALISAGFFVFFTYLWNPNWAHVGVDSFFASLVRVVTLISMCALLALCAWLVDNDAINAERMLFTEHERSERLLLNVLPASISKRLKDGSESIADGFADVTVVFADIVGFTELSATMPPEDLVAVLNDVFSRFDELAEHHGLEKIKTIGDAYMVASGLPVPRHDHAVAATLMAADMITALREINDERGHHLEIRIGLNSGPVVAGVIGKKKFIYDLWGDTVNTASRMESHGEKSSIHVSESTAELISYAFELEPRGSIKVKGKGEMTTFFVRESKPPFSGEHPPFIQKVKSLLKNSS